MEQLKLLLVDDETEFVKTLSERLKMRELDSEIALNGEEALEIVGKEPPDVIVLDLKMPGIDGMEVLRVIKKAHPKVQVIMLTGHGSENDEKEARNADRNASDPRGFFDTRGGARTKEKASGARQSRRSRQGGEEGREQAGSKTPGRGRREGGGEARQEEGARCRARAEEGRAQG